MIKRIYAYLIDYLSISMGLMIICMMLGALPVFNISSEYPFFLLHFIYMPHVFWYRIFVHPGYYGDLSWLPWIIIAYIVFESFIYSLEEHFTRGTIGKEIMKLRIKPSDQIRHVFIRIWLRNILKVTSKFLLGIPFFYMVFSKKHETLYDGLTKIRVESFKKFPQHN